MCVIVLDCCFDLEVVSISLVRDKNCLFVEVCGVSYVIFSFLFVIFGGFLFCVSVVVIGVVLVMIKFGVLICCVGLFFKDKENDKLLF